MEFETRSPWDNLFWESLEAIYIEAFPYGRKSKNIVRKILEKRRGYLHLVRSGTDVIAMALTAKLPDIHCLLIDYLGVRESKRGAGIGSQFVEYLKQWAQTEGFSGLILEVESASDSAFDSLENENRRRFWQSCGFQLVDDYIHDYKIVPELYRAMAFRLSLAAPLPMDGKVLFSEMAQFHKAAWSGRL